MSDKLNLRMGISEADFPNLFKFLSNESNQMRRTRKFCVLAENALLGLVRNGNIEIPLPKTPVANETAKVETTASTESPLKVNRQRGSFAESFQFES
jgi:hypothetical protein